jgi:hypothetical protein
MDKQGNLFISIQKLAEADFNRTSCGVEKIKSKLEPKDAEALEKLILETGVSTRKISEMLKGHEFSIGDNMIWKHRKKSCACFRSSE